jgi:hypothetical protein
MHNIVYLPMLVAHRHGQHGAPFVQLHDLKSHQNTESAQLHSALREFQMFSR